MASSLPITRELLSRAHNLDNATRIYETKIKFRPILLRASTPPPGISNKRDFRRWAREKARSSKKARPKPLSARRRRELGLYDLPRKSRRYELFLPLHRLWLGYVSEVLGGGDIRTGDQAAASKLSGADYHGAEVEVVRSRCPSRVGLRGIVIKDAMFIFEIITPKNQVKTVPKEGTVFRVEVPATTPKKDTAVANEGGDVQMEDAAVPKVVFEIHGDQFMVRAADRSTKKFKGHFLKNV